MQIVKNKKVWLFLMVGVVLLTAVCFLASGKKQKKAYANGRIVEKQEQGETVITVCWEEA